VSPLLEVIADADMSRRVLIASEHQAPIDHLRDLAPTIPTNLPTPEIAAFMMSLPPGAPPFNPRGEALQVPPEHRGWQLVMPETIAAAHALGLEVHVWTVNEPAEMRSLVEMGVDGIITDFPSRLVSLLS
jgi:glycerophosphoryl diester phosphodiesterase